MRGHNPSARTLGTPLRTLLRPLFKQWLSPTDHERWHRLSSSPTAWDSRSAKIGTMLAPGSRVLDVGAGSMRLREHLPEGCSYIPLDLVARCPEAIVCDLNTPDIPRLPETDVAVLSGVLEYLEEPGVLLSRLYESTTRIVASYAVANAAGLRQHWRRRFHGWVNDYSVNQLLSIFLHHGFHCEGMDVWHDQAIFRLRKMEIQPAFVRD